MAGPAILLLITFLAVPFVLAFVLSFTNQRLLSPNPTEFVGSDELRATPDGPPPHARPCVDAGDAAQPARDDAGHLVYPRVREFTRNNPHYPELDGSRSS